MSEFNDGMACGLLIAAAAETLAAGLEARGHNDTALIAALRRFAKMLRHDIEVSEQTE